MLLLIESPGTKHDVSGSDTERGQHRLEYSNTAEEDEEPDSDCVTAPTTADTVASCAQKMDQFLVGKSDSYEFSDRWKREFSERPSWCDANMALRQVKGGKARGNRAALYSRSVIQKALFTLGTFVHHHACLVIFTVAMFFCFCCYGLQYIRIETDIVKLWVARGGRLEEELNFLSKIDNLSFDKSHGETGLGGAYQVVIQTPVIEGGNILTQEGLLEHVTILEQVAQYEVNVAGENWTLADLCFKPPSPKIDNSFAAHFLPLIDKIIPCIWITPIDCFWEGSKAVGPHPSIEINSLGFGKEFLTSLPKMDTLSWSNIDPQALLDELSEILDLDNFNSFFQRCPTGSPNHFAFCDLISKFLEYSEKQGFEVPVDSEYLRREEMKKNLGDEYNVFGFLGKRRKRSLRRSTDNSLSVDEVLNDANRSELSINADETIKANETEFVTVNFNSKLIENITDSKQAEISNVSLKTLSTQSSETTANPKIVSSKSTKEKAEFCAKYARPFSEWLRNNTDKWHEFLELHEMPVFPNYGKVMTGGCRSFAKDIMLWPQDMIIGGAQIKNGTIESAEALQSVFLVASPTDIYNRFKNGDKIYSKPNLNLMQWNVTVAENVIRTWQRKFTKNLYNHQSNFIFDQKSDSKVAHRRVHPLASTSVADILEQFCKFNYSIIFIGYFLMLIYALQAQMKCHGCMLDVDSCIGLAFAGVLTVTFASVAGLGLATWLGIEFNAATTQIVPFLTLGIGVDNIFLLLHNYHSVMGNVKKDEVGMLMKETGMSVVMTSINNILSFLTGTLLPIPALRAFCAQSSILLTFNLIAVLTIFPAIISIDLCRRKSYRRDVCCCSVMKDSFANENSYVVDVGVKSHIQVFVILICLCLLLVGLFGLRNTTFGLEMSDVLPDQTAPAAFLKARDRYFSFYPMFAVLRGPEIDYAKNQQKIDNYRFAIGNSPFVMKNSEKEPSEKYWLSLLRNWLSSLQQKLDQAIADGLIDSTGAVVGEETNFMGKSEKLSTDVNIAYRLACSYGYTYNCTGRVGKIRFVDGSGTINIESFYNYLTAWYNCDKMMYHISLASFIPSPPEWTVEDKTARLVPPAGPFEFSQIPFYLTNLSTTPVIIEMVKNIRVICDKFNADGLPNFPAGIAFTFWEQYLHLSTNLFQAICVIAFAVFCAISIIICNPWAAGIILIILLLMTIELTGFLGLAGIKLNPISAVTVITAVGIGVEFTAHVVLAFLTSLGTRNDRMALCIDRVFVPVIHGAFSTLLGIIMLAFSEFEFVVKYFFVVMSALIFIGIINSLVLLPVLLSLIGPPCEVEPLDGSYRLPPPPPSHRQIRRIVQESQSHRRNCSDDSNTATLGFENCSTMLLIAPPQSGNGGVPRLVPNSHARSASDHIV
ncbi:unnamed protein product [Litomosoides sigmodontis]|uniref:SSD domain-containing protein n=1 Tax=Litomosoides sigmodontis TaxID=42156 RepID=A0A3P6UZ47_LITSI|nr:unnamed protein product [Litomosoides sigmodontis]